MKRFEKVREKLRKDGQFDAGYSVPGMNEEGMKKGH